MLNLLLILFVVLSIGYIVCQLAERKDSRSHLINQTMRQRDAYPDISHDKMMQKYCSRRGLTLNESRYGNGGFTKQEVAKLDIGFTPILKSR